MHASFASETSRGVTLVELLVGVAIVGVLMAFAIPSISAMLERRRVAAAATEIASMFAFARSESNVMTDQQVSVHMEPVPASVGAYSCIRVSTGDAGDSCRCNLKKVCPVGGTLLREFLVQRDTSVSFEGNDPSAGGFNAYVAQFRRGTYFTYAQTPQVTVTGNKTGAQLRVEANNVGRVAICSPQGSMSGYPVCQ